MPSKKPRHPSRRELPETPVVLPHAVITAAETGALDVAVDGTPFPPPAEGSGWTRATFGALLDAITEDRRVAVRIEVREADGSVFTDLIHARNPTPPSPVEPEEGKSETPRGRQAKSRRKKRAELVEVTGEGFVPGEDVAVAVVVSQTDATGIGHARALLDTIQFKSALRDGTGEVVLLGRVSGTAVVRRLP
ncbi:hypothetical protein [Nesterenkonia ebinurensis]|uniref:hypothetical protein n=1 Tax=Nesterenkonia ebinurensis TaxID=2608252 RepID=UPI00123E3726|nr:hypothetical protein [Nesterenkonia ebinurensis]